MDLCNRCKQISLDDLVSGIGIFHAETLKIVSKRPCALCRLIWESSNIGCQMGEIFLQLRHRAGYSPLIGVEIRCDRPDCLELESRHSFEVDAHLFAVEGDSICAFGIPAYKPALTNTASLESFEFVKGQLEICRSYHDCGSCLTDDWMEVMDQRPLRLIDTCAFEGREAGPNDLRDVCLVDTPSPAPDYLTLSHCWGGKLRDSQKTMESNLASRMQRIKVKALPRSFQDAIEITRNLGYRYLWIDALCIVQDSVANWAAEARKMGGIYFNSVATIAAETSKDNEGGVFNSKSWTSASSILKDVIQMDEWKEAGKRSTMFVWDPSLPRLSHVGRPLHLLHSSALSNRGWVFQERLLSPRTIHYTQSQILWECRTYYAAEDGLPATMMGKADTLPSLPLNLAGISNTPIDVLDTWYYDVVSHDYSRRNFTIPADRLIAISGVANLFHTFCRKYKYLAGLWDYRLGWGLSWYVNLPAPPPAHPRKPTWSWASHDSPVAWRRCEGHAIPYLVPDLTLRRTDVGTSGGKQDPFGPITSSKLQVSGLVCVACAACDSGRYTIKRTSGGDLGAEVRFDYSFSAGFNVYCLFICSIYTGFNDGCAVLLLRKLTVPNHYERVGVAFFTKLRSQHFESTFHKWRRADGQSKSITIV